MYSSADPAVIIISALFLLAAGLAGGAIPQYIRLSDRGLHRFLALGTGMLLSTIFYHMLPEALEAAGAATFVLIGLIGVFVVERLLVAETDHHDHPGHESEGVEVASDHRGHGIIGVTAFAGLSVHALMVGLGLSSQLGDMGTAVPLMTSLLIHKLSEAFSLSTIFLLAGFERRKALLWLAVFACIEPAGTIIGGLALTILPHGWELAASGLAAGTFLYVALCDLLPEVFHRREGKWGTLAALIVGILVIALFLNLGGGTHAH